MTQGGPISFHAGVGQAVRAGDWGAQCASTYDLFAAAVREDRLADAAALARYVPQEGQEAFDLFTQWPPVIRDFIRQAGVAEQAIRDGEDMVLAQICADRSRPLDPEGEWREICRLAEEAARLCEAGEAGTVVALLEEARASWLDLHDRLCDRVQGLVGLGLGPVAGPVLVAAQLPADNPIRKVALAYVGRYEAVHGKGSVSTFGAHVWDAGLLLQHAVPLALKKAQPGSQEFRKALREALENTRDVVGCHGVYNMGPTDHLGFDQRARVMVRIDNGAWKLQP